MTSHDVVGVARRALRERRIGHAGTLDPFATGLLVLMVGRATRLLPYISGEPKVYEATVRLGERTDTDDVTGEIVETAPLPTADRVDAAIARLTGVIDQLPPAYSAKQVKGVRAYAAARRGEQLELAPVEVVVHGWEVLARRERELDVRITCSGGTYIRALARDLGILAGSAAHLVRLRRVRSGAFDIEHAAPLGDLREGRAVLAPSIAAIPELPRRIVTPDEQRRIAHGQGLQDDADGGTPIALVDADGDLIAVADRDAGTLRPRVVLRAG